MSHTIPAAPVDITTTEGFDELPAFEQTVAKITDAAMTALGEKADELDATNGQALIAALLVAAHTVDPYADGKEDVPAAIQQAATMVSMSGQRGIHLFIKGLALATRNMVRRAEKQAEATKKLQDLLDRGNA